MMSLSDLKIKVKSQLRLQNKQYDTTQRFIKLFTPILNSLSA